MKIYDVSMTINEQMMVYKNIEEKKPKITILKTYKENQYNESSITIDIHTGTHIDAPFHMIDKGETIESIPLEKLVTNCQVLDLTEIKDGIEKKHLQSRKIKEGSFILFKTQNSYTEFFDSNFIYLKKSGAEYLVEKKIKGVGIDALGIERGQKNHDTHTILMNQKIIIVEGLRLKDVLEGEYKMIALPLKIEGTDGAPARIILMSE
ncbi:MAG: cyclase family protein [Clostridiales bacterium]|nr:cyclase family protein [Clostridiales bacterium]